MPLSQGIIFGLIAMLSWGFSDFIVKMAIDRAGAYRTLFYSYLTGFIVSIIFFIIFPQFFRLTAFLVILFLIEAFLVLLGYIAFYRGIEVENISIVSPIVAGYPVVIILLSYFILREVFTLHQIIAFILMILGLVLVSIKKKAKIGDNKGVYMAITAMLAFGSAIFLFGYLIKATNWIFALVFGRILTMLLIFNYLKFRKIQLKVPKSILPFLIMVGILEIGGAISYSFGVNVSLVSLVSVISSLYPLILVMLAGIFLKERISNAQKLGIFTILLGLVLISL